MAKNSHREQISHCVKHKSLRIDGSSIIWVKTHKIFTSTDQCTVQPVANEMQKALLGTILIRGGIHTKTNHPLPPVSFSDIMEKNNKTDGDSFTQGFPARYSDMARKCTDHNAILSKEAGGKVHCHHLSISSPQLFLPSSG